MKVAEPAVLEERLRLDDQLCFAMYAATHAVVRAYRPLLADLNLTYPQYLVMLVLWQDGARSLNQIAARLDLPANAITPLIDRLERAGLVVRHRDRTDRRVWQVSLTPLGAGLEAATARAQKQVVCATTLDPEELAALRGALQQLLDRMRGPDPADAAAPVSPEPMMR